MVKDILESFGVFFLFTAFMMWVLSHDMEIYISIALSFVWLFGSAIYLTIFNRRHGIE